MRSFYSSLMRFFMIVALVVSVSGNILTVSQTFAAITANPNANVCLYEIQVDAFKFSTGSASQSWSGSFNGTIYDFPTPTMIMGSSSGGPQNVSNSFNSFVNGTVESSAQSLFADTVGFGFTPGGTGYSSQTIYGTGNTGILIQDLTIVVSSPVWIVTGTIINTKCGNDLRITKTVLTPTTGLVGDPVAFELEIVNGYFPTTGIIVEDIMSSLNLTNMSRSASFLPTPLYDTGLSTRTIIDSVPHQYHYLIVTGYTTMTGSYTNTGKILSFVGEGYESYTTNTGNDIATGSYVIINPSYDLEITKDLYTGIMGEYTPTYTNGITGTGFVSGDLIAYKVTIAHLSGDRAKDVYVQDILPLGLELISTTIDLIVLPDPYTNTGSSGLYYLPLLMSGDDVDMYFVARILTGSQYTGIAINNQASLTGDTMMFDTTTANNSDNLIATGYLPWYNLTISKNVSTGTYTNGISGTGYLSGDLITFTIVVTNTGGDTATGVMVQDFLPAGLTYVSSNIAPAPVGIYSLGNIVSGQQITLTIVTRLTTGLALTGLAMNNTALLTGVTIMYDISTGNNTATGSFTGYLPYFNLVITKTSLSGDTLEVAKIARFVITVVNNGPDTATAIAVTDTVSLLYILSGSASTGSWNNGTATWNISTLVSGATATLRIDAIPTVQGTGYNSGLISSYYGLDINTGNNKTGVIFYGYVVPGGSTFIPFPVGQVPVTNNSTTPLISNTSSNEQSSQTNTSTGPKKKILTLPSGLMMSNDLPEQEIIIPNSLPDTGAN
ncbi:MAG TPA: DUF11 domain-containing protein [Candidatus Absconditabacterales bacterium]|nr:DUF11 domain-containing protein [Candidatus Absconditabacterales bacterium]